MSARSISDIHRPTPPPAEGKRGETTSLEPEGDDKAEKRSPQQASASPEPVSPSDDQRRSKEPARTDPLPAEQQGQPQSIDPSTASPQETEHPNQDEGEEGEPAYEEPEVDQLLPPLDFKPYFTLIEDSETGEHFHPDIHYLFADGDTELLTNAALDTIAINIAANNREEVEHEERIIILDMSPDGKEVASATSLSPQWQNLKITVSQAPSWGTDATAADRGLMLKISGQEARKMWASNEKTGALDDPEDLARTFTAKLQRLDEIIGYEEKESVAEEPSGDKGVDA